MQPLFWHLLKNCIFFRSKVTSKTLDVTFSYFDKKENVTFKVLEETFERKKIQFFRRCQNDGCEVSQLYYSVSKPPPNFLYEIINSKREKKPMKIYENHKIGKLFLLCSLEGYGQHFMSRSLGTKTTVSSTRSFWYNIVLGEIGLISE